MKLLVQSDDYGFTEGIVDGTIKGIKDGIVKNTGIFINMPCLGYAAKRIKETDVCLGIDINLLAGAPVSDVNTIKPLLKDGKSFYSSKDLLKNNKLINIDKYIYHFEHDPFDYDACVIETRNQILKFKDVFGKLPAYINSHSIMTPNSEKAAYDVAKEFGITKMSSDIYFGDDVFNDIVFDNYYDYSSLEEQTTFDYTSYFMKHMLPSLREDKINFLLVHCGYPDKALFGQTSLTLQRMNDVALVCDSRIKEFIREHNIELITYDEL